MECAGLASPASPAGLAGLAPWIGAISPLAGPRLTVLSVFAAPHSPRRQKLNLRMKSLSLDSPESTEHARRGRPAHGHGHHGGTSSAGSGPHDPHSSHSSSSRLQCKHHLPIYRRTAANRCRVQGADGARREAQALRTGTILLTVNTARARFVAGLVFSAFYFKLVIIICS